MEDVKSQGSDEHDQSGSFSVDRLSIPKGGGALKGLDETYEHNNFKGSGALKVPIETMDARGLVPDLALEYRAGSGNGSVGLGFQVGLSVISRRTNLGIPTYTEKDRFELDGKELVPMLDDHGSPVVEQVQKSGIDWEVAYYIQRFEGPFSAISRWVNQTDGTSHWELRDRENVASVYGSTAVSRISDPSEAARTFSWLIDLKTDPKGNKIQFEYAAENTNNVPPTIFEVHRNSTSNRYISKISYGNYVDGSGDEQFAYQVIFDYGSYNSSGQKTGEWTVRKDPFSRYNTGFEVRTYRLCRQILLFNHFVNDLGTDPVLVKKYALNYQETETLSQLIGVREVGYRQMSGGTPWTRQSPEIVFSYSNFEPDTHADFERFEIEGAFEVPGYLEKQQFFPVDLNGEGISGLLHSTPDNLVYYEPLGNGKYQAPESLWTSPINRDLKNATNTLTDINGDGVLELVVQAQERSGYYIAESGGWSSFHPMEHISTQADNPYVESVDITGDGRHDLVLVDEDNVTYNPSLGYDGYAPVKSHVKPKDLPQKALNLVEGVIGFQDMFGDGLFHRVEVTNGKVSCWPDMGYGVFGEEIVFGNSPVFPDDLDGSRLHFADLDGTGTADMIYVCSEKVLIFLNQSGNSFADPISITLPELFTDIDSISFSDVQGNGTQCLVFTKIDHTPRHYFYDFVGTFADGKTALKPYLLVEVDNHRGAKIQFDYKSSVHYYLEDKKAGYSWETQLPFPVQVVSKVTHIDQLTGTVMTNKYTYHNGYFDSAERLFQGFAFVEVEDTETYEEFKHSSNPYYPPSDLNEELYVPPVLTKNWYYTGAYYKQDQLLRTLETQMFQGDSDAFDFPGSEFVDTTPLTVASAHLALSGKSFRTEVFDSTSAVPYSVEQQNYKVHEIQPSTSDQHASWQVLNLSVIHYEYDRINNDPRVTQTFALAWDNYGNTTRSAEIDLARRANSQLVQYPEQAEVLALVTETKYINMPSVYNDVSHSMRWIGLSYEEQHSQAYHIAPDSDGYFSYGQASTEVTAALGQLIAYGEATMPSSACAMLRSAEVTRFWDTAQSAMLPVGQVGERGLVHNVDTAVFSDTWLTNVYGTDLTTTEVQHDGGYFHNLYGGNYWWNRGEVKIHFDESTPEAFFQLKEVSNTFVATATPPQLDALAKKMVVGYDSYYLFENDTKNYYCTTGYHHTSSVWDYQACEIAQLTDPNKNIHQALYDPLGFVMATSLLGTEGGNEAGGMRLYPVAGQPAEYVIRTENSSGGTISLSDVITDPCYYLQGATGFFFYNELAWEGTPAGQPLSAVQLLREQFYREQTADDPSTVRKLIEYSDGMGRALERKINAEPGPALSFDESVSLLVVRDFPVFEVTPDRWLVSGRVVYNNKGQVTEAYEPYFSNTYLYETQDQVTKSGAVPPPTITRYDALERVIQVDTPKGFFSKTTYQPWEIAEYDENDTVLDSDYYQEFMAHYPSSPTDAEKDEKNALDKAALCYNTPSRKVLDTKGHTIRSIQDNLGKTSAANFDALTTSSITAQDIWDELNTQGYLDHDGFLTAKFQPYFDGFTLKLDTKYDSLLDSITAVLLQGVLTTYFEVDIEGRHVKSIDPRLYYDNVTTGTTFVNLTEVYPMELDNAWSITSSDAGLRKIFKNIFNSHVFEYDPRSIVSTSAYDQLQRLLTVKVTEYDSTGSPTWTGIVNRLEYGESQSNPEDNNLIGQVFRTYDQAGTITNAVYSIQNRLLQTTRELTETYKGNIDWTDPSGVKMDPDPYPTTNTYDAIGLLITQETPDETVTTYGYNLRGLITSIQLAYKGGGNEDVITEATYDARSLRTKVTYGNSAETVRGFEDTTGNLMTIHTTRPSAAGDPVVQDVTYAYDPVKNPTRSRNNTFSTVFCNNQSVEPLSDYTYDLIYRLINASGRQHVNIKADTHIDGFKQSIYGPLCATNPSDATKLENYTETYAYDDSNNLTSRKHVASSASWTTDNEVNQGNNLLKNVPADAGGNMLQLMLNSATTLNWDFHNNLASTGIIERPKSVDDADYFRYDRTRQRIRKVVERSAHGGSVTEITETIYVGNFQTTKTYSVGSGAPNLKTERQLLRVKDSGSMALNAYYWKTGDTSHPTGSRQVRFQLTTDLNSVALELDQSASIISYEEYFPFGGTAIMCGNKQSEVSLKYYRFTGKERDDSTGLYYYGARYYAPWLGRWLNPDPAGPVDGLNLLAYVENSPLKHEDPTGNGIGKRSATQADVDRWQKIKSKRRGDVLKFQAQIKLYKNSTSTSGKQNLLLATVNLQKAESKYKYAVTRHANLRAEVQAKKSGAYTKRKAYHNPGGALYRMEFPFRSAGVGGTKLSSKPGGSPYIVDFFARVKKKKVLDSQTESDVRNYTMMANKYITTMGGSVTVVATNRKTTGSIGYVAGQIAEKERDLANAASPGTYGPTQVVGHVPDVGVTGVSHSPMGWFAQSKLSNSLVGGGLSAGRVIDEFVVRERDGYYYRY